MKITPGTVIRDNTNPFRKLHVLSVTGLSYVQDRVCQWATCTRYRFPNTRIRIDRIHTDGKPRKSGFSVITYGPQE